MSESGRAVVSYHSVLVFNVLGMSGFGEEKIPETVREDFEQPLVDELGQPVDGDAAEALLAPRLRPEQRRDHLRDIRHATKQMSALMEEVLVLGRVEAGKMKCVPVEMNLPDFCSRLVDEQLSATHRRCPIELTFDNVDAPATGDEGLLRHILANLLSNAVRFTERGEVRLRMDFRQHVSRIEVIDTGCGMDEETLEHIFEAFFSTKKGGSGLGLPTAKKIIEGHGGRITVRSELGRGTQFTIHLPIPRQLPAESSSVAASAPSASSP